MLAVLEAKVQNNNDDIDDEDEDERSDTAEEDEVNNRVLPSDRSLDSMLTPQHRNSRHRERKDMNAGAISDRIAPIARMSLRLDDFSCGWTSQNERCAL